MKIVWNKIDNHLAKNKAEKEVQAGFTNDRRIEDNIFILQLCIRNTFRQRKQLFIAAVDCKNSFSDIKREKLIEALKTYKFRQ